jgi:chemotaxis protein MotB
MRRYILAIFVPIFLIGTAGCAFNFYKGQPQDKEKIEELTQRVDELEEAKRMLEERLRTEMGERGVSLELTKRGLVITMANDILFDSGKAKLKAQSHDVLRKVADVIKERLPDRYVGIEGHTDNVPIKHSGWKSNWELSTARATSVLHYMIDECGLEPQKLSAIGYGEYRPITDNTTAKLRARNRRVEIIILPKEMSKRSYEEVQTKVSEEARLSEESQIRKEEAGAKDIK